jgi:hypothetical protein
MKYLWIENYAGTWEDPTGRTLVIKVTDEHQATVSLFVSGEPMARPWCGNLPASDLLAEYSPPDGPGLEVNLGRPGLSLELNYEFPESWAPDEGETLSVGFSRYEEDTAADAYVDLFLPLERYSRRDAEP